MQISNLVLYTDNLQDKQKSTLLRDEYMSTFIY